jgi:hypothetical protein
MALPRLPLDPPEQPTTPEQTGHQTVSRISVQLDGRTTGQNSDTLDIQGPRLWENPGRSILLVGEFIESERISPREDLNKPDRIKMALEHCEVALNPEQEHILRNALRALHQQRSAKGTFDEIQGGFEFDQQVLDHLDAGLDASEAVRVRGALEALLKSLTIIGRRTDGDFTSMRREVKKLAEVARRVLDEQLVLNEKTVADAVFIAAEVAVAAQEAAELAEQQQRLEATTEEPEPET